MSEKQHWSSINKEERKEVENLLVGDDKFRVFSHKGDTSQKGEIKEKQGQEGFLGMGQQHGGSHAQSIFLGGTELNRENKK